MVNEIAELQLFVEIVRAGNLSAAARVLNSSPAAMSGGLTHQPCRSEHLR